MGCGGQNRNAGLRGWCVWGLSWAASCVPPEQRSREGESHFGHLIAGQALKAGTSPPANPRGAQPLQLCPAMGFHPPGAQGAAGTGAQHLAGLTTHLSILKPLLHWEYYCFFSYCYITIPVTASPPVSFLCIF